MSRRVLYALVILVLLSTVLSAPVVAQEGDEPIRTGLGTDAPPYGVRGPYWVGTMELVIEDEERPLPVTVWYPAQEGVEETIYIHASEFAEILPGVEQPGHAIPDGNVDMAGAPYPLVIFSHGNMWYRQASAYLTEHLASHGFVVMAADHIGNTLAYNAITDYRYPESMNHAMINHPRDIQRQIEYAAEITAENGTLAGMIDIERIAVTGHSFGGYSALASAGARVDITPVYEWCEAVANDPAIVDEWSYFVTCDILATSEADLQALLGIDVGKGGLWPAFDVTGVDAIIPLASGGIYVSTAEGLADVTIPVMIMIAGEDSVATYELHTGPVYENLPDDNKTLVIFEGAEHFLFAASCFGAWFDEPCPECCTDPVWDMDHAHDLTNHFMTAFLFSVLYDDVGAAAALAPEAVQFPGITYETTGF